MSIYSDLPYITVREFRCLLAKQKLAAKLDTLIALYKDH